MTDIDGINRFHLYSLRVYYCGIISVFYSILYIIVFELSIRYSNVNIHLIYDIFLFCYNGALILLLIIFLIWFNILSRKINIISRNLTETHIPKIIYFFIPIINFYKPYIFIRDIWLILSEENKSLKKYIFIKIWWLFFILSSIFHKIVFIFYFNIKSINTFYLYINLRYIDIFFNIIYTLILIYLVKKIFKKINNIYSLSRGLI